jgi:hypothetical protein
MPNIDISTMRGFTFSKIMGMEEGSEEIIFATEKNVHSNKSGRFTMFHSQDCCEYVRLVEVHGDVEDLLNTPIIEAYISSNKLNTELDKRLREEYPPYESQTWTFYSIRTIKGSVTLRWLGESHGYYSEEVDLVFEA